MILDTASSPCRPLFVACGRTSDEKLGGELGTRLSHDQILVLTFPFSSTEGLVVDEAPYVVTFQPTDPEILFSSGELLNKWCFDQV